MVIVFTVLLAFFSRALEAQSTTRSPSDPILTDKAWNRWTGGEFVVLSIDNDQGKFLSQHLPQIKTWSITRWGLPEPKLSVECRIVAVPTTEIMEKLFRMRGSYTESVTDERGRLKLHVVWLLFDHNPAECIPPSLLRICLSEYEKQAGIKFDIWAIRGMSVLSQTYPQIRESMKGLGTRMTGSDPVFSAKGLLTLDREKWSRLNEQTRNLFDVQAAAMCLLLRKEFGQKNFLQFITSGSAEANVNAVFGFADYAELDKTYKRYVINLANDINTGRTPDSYLEVALDHQRLKP
jgi:hypothetical protein